tara:strand:+ start:168 stop:605 length:438 start_codon:yes stop_codon:yes gene_type:complete
MKRAGTWHPTFSLPLRPKTPHPVLSPALAPASGSTLQLIRSSAPGHKDLRFPFRTGLRQAVPRSNFPSMAETSSGCIADPVRRPFPCDTSSASDRVGPIHERRRLRFVIDPLASDRSLPHADLGKHMDSISHVFPVWIFSAISGR